MKTLNRIALLALMALSAAFGQVNSLVQTSTTAAVTASTLRIPLTSVTGITAGSLTDGTLATQLWVVDKGQNMGEAMIVTGVSGLVVTVSRASGATSAHASGAMVLYGHQDWFYKVDPQGTCTRATIKVNPYVNTINGNQWFCSSTTGTWVAGWGNDTRSPQLLTSTATASVAGATAIVGPLVEISGTNAITSFTMSTGWNAQGFCIYPTGAYTTVAGNNISEASTGDVDQIQCWVYNARTAAFSPTY